MRMSEILAEELNQPDSHPIVALSGPNLSGEIAQGMPAVSVAASSDPDAARRVQALFSSGRRRIRMQPGACRPYSVPGASVSTEIMI